MKKIYQLLLLLFSAASSFTYAQTADTINLVTVDVSAPRSEIFTSGVRTSICDSSIRTIFSSVSLADMLTLKSSVFIKSYGSGGIATISSRGTEARQNAILWNGFNLNSASLGLTDLSIVPAQLTDNITLLHGGSSAVNGNSALGSTVVLENNTPDFTKSNLTSLTFEGGSFGNIHGSLSMQWNGKHVASKTVVFYDEAENNFNFINSTDRDLPEVEQEHAATENYGLIQDLNFKIKPGQILSTGIWYQVTNREIPPLMTIPESFADQRDSNLRIYAGYKWILNKSVFNLKGAYFDEFQYYNDSHYKINTNYHVNNYFGEFEWRYFISEKLILNSGFTYNEGVASFKEYAGKKNRSSTALFASMRYNFFDDWRATINLRQEFSNIEQPPLSPSFSLEGNIYKQKVLLFMQVGRQFSLPSMNDLYWIPGGNSSLLPEDGWSEEFGFIFFKYHRFLPSFTMTGFNSIIDNWIKWLPTSGGIYAPDNLRQVHSRGIELIMNYEKKFNGVFINSAFNYTFCRSTVTKAAHESEQAILDKQLMYVPEQVFNFNISINYHDFTLFFSNSYIGERYTTFDNSKSLPAYNVADIAIEKSFVKLKIPFSVFFKVMNLYNTTYQVLAYHPTPGRWYSAGIKINFSVTNSK